MRVSFFTAVVFSVAVSGGPVSAREWVEFPSATTPPTPFALSQAEAQGTKLKQEPPTPLRGLLIYPEGKGPFPSVVLLHGCDGIQPFQEQWAGNLASLGYAALLVDSHGPSGIGEDCHNWPPTANTRSFDAYGALRYLRDRPDIDDARIGVLGWDTGGRAAMAVVEVNGVQQLVQDRFKTGIALYPSGRLHPPVSVPALVLIGDRDNCSPQLRPDAQATGPLRIETVLDATHGFDNPRFAEPMQFTYAQMQQCVEFEKTTMSFSKAAQEFAAERIRTFLQEHLR
jgi:dienelactone hydrolase